MPDSNFWRDLKDDFRKLDDPRGELRVHYDIAANVKAEDGRKDAGSIIGTNYNINWSELLGANESVRLDFEALATLAGSQVPRSPTRSPRDAWFDSLRLNIRRRKSPDISLTSQTVERKGAAITWLKGGMIENLCEASAKYCAVLDKETLEKESKVTVDRT